MKPEIAKQICPEIASEFLSEITYIHTLLDREEDKAAFFAMGYLSAQLQHIIDKEKCNIPEMTYPRSNVSIPIPSGTY
jgi:hypothetical protein